VPTQAPSPGVGSFYGNRCISIGTCDPHKSHGARLAPGLEEVMPTEAWDDARFHNASWTCDAWEDNEWNGKVPGGSGETWHYKIVWVGPELEDSPCWRDGGYEIWGEFDVIMSHGTVANEHFWDAHAIPTGYGGY
jgi:hypothetical protein